MRELLEFFVGRIANFINGELYGRIIEGSAWLAVRFPSEVLLWANQPKLYKKQLLSLKEVAPFYRFLCCLRFPSQEIWMEWVNKASLSPDSVYSSYISYVCQLIFQSAYQSPIKRNARAFIIPSLSLSIVSIFFGRLIAFLYL